LESLSSTVPRPAFSVSYDRIYATDAKPTLFCDIVREGHGPSAGRNIIDMNKLTIPLTAGLLSLATSLAVAGRGNPAGTGQPSQSCSVTMVTPGNAVNARGSAFNPNGVSGAVYANPTSRGGIASGNSHVVAQYDVACYHQTNRVMRQAASGHGH